MTTAPTAENRTSSRAARWMEIQYNGHGDVVGAQVGVALSHGGLDDSSIHVGCTL
jgi:hypothetical protein